MDPTLLLSSASIDEAAASFINRIHEIDPRVQTDLIEKAFRFSWKLRAYDRQGRAMISTRSPCSLR